MNGRVFVLSFWLGLHALADAGRPIVLTEQQACRGTELVVIADIHAAQKVPPDKEDPFLGGSKWDRFGFTHFAQMDVEQVLFGKRPRRGSRSMEESGQPAPTTVLKRGSTCSSSLT